MQLPVLTAANSTRVASIFLGAFAMFGGWYLYTHLHAPQYETMTVHAAPLSETIEVAGTVTAAQNVELGFAQSGRVSRVYAKVGDKVAAGSLIAEVEDGDLRALVSQKVAALETQQAQLASLQAGTRPEQLAVTQAQIDGDQASLAQASAALLNAIQSAYTTSDDAVRNKVDQFVSNPRTSTPTIVFTSSDSQNTVTLVNDRISAESMLNAWQSRISAPTPSEDLPAAQTEAQRNLAQVISLLADANTALVTAIPSGTTQSQIASYITAVATARTSVNAAQSALTSAIAARNAASATLERDQKNLVLQQAGATTEDLAAKVAQVAVARADLQNARAQLQKMQIIAPFSGIITRMDTKVGAIVAPTNPQISMISDGTFQIETYVPEIDIAALKLGNPATTTLDAYGPDMPFAAKVILIDPAQTLKNGVSTYKTTLQFLVNDTRIRTGMTANVVITTDEIPNALTVPSGAVFEKDGAKFIRVLRAGTYADVPIVLGVQTLGNVEVRSGLSEGEVIVLNPDAQ